MILSKNCEKSAQFFVDVLGLKINNMSTPKKPQSALPGSRKKFKYTSQDHNKIML